MFEALAVKDATLNTKIENSKEREYRKELIYLLYERNFFRPAFGPQLSSLTIIFAFT